MTSLSTYHYLEDLSKDLQENISKRWPNNAHIELFLKNGGKIDNITKIVSTNDNGYITFLCKEGYGRIINHCVVGAAITT